MRKISLISVYNNSKKLKEMLDSASIQENVDIDYVLIDNSNSKFKSAAQALNFGVKKAIGDVIVFLHQDIVFLDSNQLSNMFDFAINNRNIIFGAAGVQHKHYNLGIISSIYEGPYKNKYNSLIQPKMVYTLDECLIGCHRDCLSKVSFDEVVCDGWHLYGADLCLQANLVDGMSVMVLPMNIWHKSTGNADKSYYITQNKLGKKYSHKYKIINTTNGFVYTNFIKRSLLNFYRKIRYGI